MTIKLKNDSATTLTAAALIADLTLTVADTGSMPALAAGQSFTATLSDGVNYERVTVTDVATGLLTLSARGIESTVKRDWAIDER
ncbi:unnamed protein product [marine sediment metagenome]|uniref:Uncharacterized protein n=1 Tax=marine sediment metagenome TaxID=412755 RepID=X1SV86_9ZZZZ